MSSVCSSRANTTCFLSGMLSSNIRIFSHLLIIIVNEEIKINLALVLMKKSRINIMIAKPKQNQHNSQAQINNNSLFPSLDNCKCKWALCFIFIAWIYIYNFTHRNLIKYSNSSENRSCVATLLNNPNTPLATIIICGNAWIKSHCVNYPVPYIIK